MRRLVTTVLLLLATTAAALDQSGGTQSPFTLGAGSRVQALGRAGSAVVDDATSLHWNSARLADLDRAEFLLYRNRLFVDDIGYHAAFYAQPTMDLGTIGVGYLRLDVGDIERRGDRNQLLGNFDDSESALLLGYARRLDDAFAVGTSLRLIQQSVDGVSDNGVGLDVASTWDHDFGDGAHGVTAGLAVHNLIEPAVRLDQEEVPDPRALTFSTAYRGAAPDRRLEWLAVTDVEFVRDTDQRWGLGAEVSLDRTLALRAGLDDGHATFGFGLAYRGVRLDYAMRQDDDLARNDRFTVAVSFGAGMQERRAERLAARERDVADALARQLAERERSAVAGARAAAEAARAEERWDDAMRHYRRVLAVAPQDSSAQAGLDVVQHAAGLRDAFAELESGEAARAAASFQALLVRWPDSTEARRGLDDARQRLRVAEDRERQLENLFRDALTRFADGDLAGAEGSLDELLRVDPDSRLGHELRQKVIAARTSRGETALARARASARDRDYARALSSLAAARRDLGDSAELSVLERTWRKAQEDLAAERAAALLAREASTVESPAPTTRRELTTAQKDDLRRRFREGLAAFQSGDFENAIRRWRSVWIEAPGFEGVDDYLVKAYLFEGIALYSQGDYDKAIERCERVLEVDPDNAKARRYRDRIREEQSELERGVNDHAR